MPISLSKIATNCSSVTIPIGDDSVTIEYYPGRVTEKTFANLQRFTDTNESTLLDNFQTFNETLAHLIKSWDLYEDEAQTVLYPITPDRLAELPIAFRTSVIQAIMSDLRPNTMAS